MTRRILTIVHGYPPAARAGAEIAAARCAGALARRGIDSRVLAFESFKPGKLTWDDTVEDGAVVRRLSGDPGLGDDPFRASYDSAEIARAVRETISHWQPHLVYFFSGYLMSSSVVRTAADMHVPVVVNLTDPWWFCHRVTLLRPDGSRCDGPTPGGCLRCHAERKRRWRMPAAALPGMARLFWSVAPRLPLVRSSLGAGAVESRAATLAAALRQVSAFIAPSRFIAGFYERQGVDAGRIHVIRQGLDVGARPERVPADHLRIAFLGQLKAHKGVTTLLQAWPLLDGPKPRTLTLWGSAGGEGDFGDRVRQMIATLPGVDWRGAFQPGDVWNVLASTDAIVVPSLCVENSPNVILEAQAMRVPVVGSSIGGIAELVRHDQNGLLFETGNARDLAAQLQRLLDEPDLTARLAGGALHVGSAADEEEATLRVFQPFLPA
jgi:glycosyltransferase involved in cell wall biosynthesis